MNDDDLLSPSSDVDLYLVSSADPLPKPPRKLKYRGVVLEVSTRNADSLDDEEAILADHRLAGTFSRYCVAIDTTGQLKRLKSKVVQEFSKRRWVFARCSESLAMVNDYLDALHPEMPFYDQVTVLSFGTGNLTDLLTVARLRNPTVRKKYALAGEVLVEMGRADLHEKLLRLLGCEEFTRRQVSDHLDQLSTVFDAACEIDKPSYRFSGDISSSGRKITIDGSQDLIETGHHRDAVFWLLQLIPDV